MFNLTGGVLVWDFETTVKDVNGKTDNSPFNKDNRCVGVWWCMIKDGIIGPVHRLVWNHNEKPQPDGREAFQKDLDRADLIVAHNAKFDTIWALELEFKISSPIWCTMIAEFVFARAQQISLSLENTAIRRGVTHKKADLVTGMFKDGIGFEAMPFAIVDEYAEADVVSCAEIFLAQVAELEENQGLRPVIELMNEMLEFLVEIERNGINIDIKALDTVEADFISERDILIKRLKEIARHVLGDTPFNLNSGPDQTKIVYGRVVTDRKLHATLFNIGVGANGKPLPTPRYKPSKHSACVRASTAVIKKTVAQCCPTCNGSGRQFKLTKKGEPYKNQPRCKTCDGDGAIYQDTGETAGLKMVPLDPSYASINGFKVDKITNKLLINQAREKGYDLAVEYLEKMSRLNAVNTYLNSFVAGIRTWVREDGILHANFNQTVARTGRLSSSNPNFQNIPKSQKFPVRQCIVSRFGEQNLIMEADFSGLEFRVAGELSRDPQILDDILSGKDVHKQTASIINRCSESEVSKEMRQAAKAYTFAPLYGGTGMSEPAHIQEYFKTYFSIYSGLKDWHRELMDGVLKDGIVRTPSGREFFFPNAERSSNGKIKRYSQQIVNYPVQSFATGDCVPLACIRALQYFRKHNLKSKLILTVHDSLVVDCLSEEKDKVVAGLQWAMEGVKDDLQRRFNYTPSLPLDIEIEAGRNWMEMRELV